MFEAMKALTGLDLQLERELKVRPDGRVCLVRDQKTRYIYREFAGSDRVYQRLQPVLCLGLPRILGVTHSGDTVMVLEEYIPGDTLAEILEKGCLNQQQAEQILRQLCAALMQLHGMGIVHRDIKPENVILRGDQAVLIDFHASRLENPRQDTDTRVMGTSGYAAPEQYGFAQTDARADIYALGVLTNEMLIGCHPSTRLAPGRLRPVIEKCIEVNMDKRYGSVMELLLALEAGGQQQNLRPWKIATVGAWVVAAAALILALQTPQPVLLAPEQPQAETVTATLPGNLEIQMFHSEAIPVADEPWAGEPIAYLSRFQCDTDEDGTPETYAFGLKFNKIPVNGITDDQCGFRPGETDNREVYPCVFRVNPDGSTGEPALEFQGLLENPQIRLWRVSNLTSPAPKVETWDGGWPGGIRVIMNADDHLGLWYYEITADLAGQHLTAGTTTRRVLIENSDSK